MVALELLTPTLGGLMVGPRQNEEVRSCLNHKHKKTDAVMARGDTITITNPTTFSVEECIDCGVEFALTAELQRRRRQDHKTFYCPNGHGQVYTAKTDAQKLREAEQAAVEAARLASARLQVERDQRLAAERELKRHKTRAAAGVCPCCQRSFVQLQRHMKTKHPDFAKSAAGSGGG